MPGAPQVLAAATAACTVGVIVGYVVGRQWERRRRQWAAQPMVIDAALLAGRTVVVTGGSSGIGREIALQCAAQGAQVLVMDIRDTPLEGGTPTSAAFEERRGRSPDGSRCGGGVAFFLGDTTSAAACEAAVQEVVGKWSRLDVWVNNAAIDGVGDLINTTEEDWDRVLAVNAKGYFLGAQAAVRQMLKQSVLEPSGLRGRIINISSQHGIVACPGDIAYGVGKAAAVYLTRQIAVDFAARGIACNAVAPGKIITGCDSDRRSYSIARTPCPRLGRPSDVASAVLFLASDLSSDFLTGANLMVDGGWTAY